MITFLTFLLGLTWGPHPVEVGLLAPAARVELRLDGVEAAVLESPPWRVEVDFGNELAPHRLEAIAFDSDGAEIARATRYINMALPQSQAELLVERTEDGRASARLAWQSVAHSEPERIEVWFDGEPLAVDDPAHIPLPAHDPAQVHVLSAEVSFAGGDRTRADVALGGFFGDSVSAENTAVAIVVEGRRKLRSVDETEGLVLAAGQPASVLAVEHDRADLVMVVDRSAVPILASFGHDLRLRERKRQGELGPLSSAGLKTGDRVFLMLAAPALRGPAEEAYEIFPISTPLTSEEGGVTHLLTHYRMNDDAARPQKISKAVAVAGIHAASGRRPRVVVLVAGPEPPDPGEIDPAHTRRFLERLGVPLRVWFVAKTYRELRPEELRTPQGRKGETAYTRNRKQQLAAVRQAWGEVEEIESLNTLVETATELRKDLASQRVIWIDGRSLPTELSLADHRRGAALLR